MSTGSFSVLGLQPSFGFGDRIGLATAGHVAAMKAAGNGIAPIFPQQSIREMKRTGRSPQEVIDAALTGMRSSGWSGICGADADHLKTPADVDATAAAGFTFYTIDPSDFVDGNADDYNESQLRERFASVFATTGWIHAVRQSARSAHRRPVVHDRRAGGHALRREVRPRARTRDRAWRNTFAR